MSRLDEEYNALRSMGYEGSIDDMRYKYREDFPQQYNTRWDFLTSRGYPGTIDDKEYLFWGTGEPAIDFLFAGATELDPRIDFTRGSAATGWVNGGLRVFSNREPRFVTDPVTGYSGLLLEPFASTNLLTNSTTVVDQTVLVPSGDITLSFYGEGELSFTGAATGALQGAGDNARAAITVTAAAGELVLSVTDGSPILGQLEEGAKATSFIITGGSQVTRAGEFFSLPTGDWYSPDRGTLIVSAATPIGETVATFGDIVIVSDSDEMKTYTVPYSSPIGATRLELGAGIFGSVQYYPRVLS